MQENPLGYPGYRADGLLSNQSILVVPDRNSDQLTLLR